MDMRMTLGAISYNWATRNLPNSPKDLSSVNITAEDAYESQEDGQDCPDPGALRHDKRVLRGQSLASRFPVKKTLVPLEASSRAYRVFTSTMSAKSSIQR